MAALQRRALKPINGNPAEVFLGRNSRWSAWYAPLNLPFLNQARTQITPSTELYRPKSCAAPLQDQIPCAPVNGPVPPRVATPEIWHDCAPSGDKEARITSTQQGRAYTLSLSALSALLLRLPPCEQDFHACTLRGAASDIGLMVPQRRTFL